jgi:L-fucose isomerase-like protein
MGVKLGLCPIGKFVFSNEDAVRYKTLLQEKLKTWGVDFVDLEGVLEDGLIKDQKHVDPAVTHFSKNNINALFIPHCNFGSEGAAAMIAHKLNVPTLLWGPRDDAPLADGRRLRDSLCGMLATSKVLGKLGVKFTYIENCGIDDDKLQQGVDTFLRAANIADVFRRGARIGFVGNRIDFFWTTIVNESELLEKFNVEVLPIDMVEFIRHAKSRVKENPSLYQKKVRDLRNEWIVEGFDQNDEPLMHVFAVHDQLRSLAKDNALEGFAFQDFMSIIDETGAYCCLSNSLISEDYALGCESDVHGAISDILIRRATLNSQPGYLADVTVRHPQDDNGVLLWHGGAAVSMRDPQVKPRLGHHWILPSPLSGMTHFKLKEGPITVVRFDGDRGSYQLAIGQGQSIPGPYTQNNYVWMKVNNWPKWERQLMEGPFIHHVAMAYGHYGEALLEAVKYIPGLSPVKLGE